MGQEHPQNVDQHFDDDDETEYNPLYELYDLCASAGQLKINVIYGDEDHEEHNSSWNNVRVWIQTHTELKASLEVRDGDGKTALHIACEHQPPLDVMCNLLYVHSSTPKLLEIQDIFGWTPLHYLCALSAPPEVVQLIAEMCSEAKLLTTNKGSTPLHFALIGPFREYPDLIATLASTGASRNVDTQGMLVRVFHAGRNFCVGYDWFVSLIGCVFFSLAPPLCLCVWCPGRNLTSINRFIQRSLDGTRCLWAQSFTLCLGQCHDSSQGGSRDRSALVET
jgi:hypothetical protein